MEEVNKKMSFTHIDVNFDVTYDGNQSKPSSIGAHWNKFMEPNLEPIRISNSSIFLLKKGHRGKSQYI